MFVVPVIPVSLIAKLANFVLGFAPQLLPALFFVLFEPLLDSRIFRNELVQRPALDEILFRWILILIEDRAGFQDAGIVNVAKQLSRQAQQAEHAERDKK